MPFNFQITFNDGPTSAGDSPQLSGRISGMVITNNSGESIGYSSDSGSSFATLTAGSSVTLGSGDPTSFRFRRVNSGSYPLAVDAVVTMSVPLSDGYWDTDASGNLTGLVWIDTSPAQIIGLKGSYLGVFADTATLQTAHPAASKTGYSALVGTASSSVPYISNGTNWVEAVVKDTAGNISANVVHRTGALASLQSLVAPEGEIAFATDKKALVLVSPSGAGVIHSSGPARIGAADFINGIPGYFGAGETVLTFPLAGTGGTPGITGVDQLSTFLQACTYDQNANVIVQLQQGDYSGVPFSNSVPLKNVKFRGHDWDVSETVATATTNVTIVGPNDSLVTLQVADSSQFAVGKYAALFPIGNTANSILLAGVWAVTAVPDATHITINYIGETPPTVAVFDSSYSLYSLSSVISFSAGGGYRLHRIVCNQFAADQFSVSMSAVGFIGNPGTYADIVIKKPALPEAGRGLCLSYGGSFSGNLFCEDTLAKIVSNDPGGNGLLFNKGISDPLLSLICVGQSSSTALSLPKGQRISVDTFKQCNAGVGVRLGAGAGLSASTAISVGVTTPYQATDNTPLTANVMGPQLQFVAVG